MWSLWHSLDPGVDPTFHAALEEVCLRDFKDSFFFVWVAPPSVHLGKNQNLWAEVSLDQCLRDSVSLHRRLSGGGAVYHDYGNLNYSIITNGEPSLAFDKYLSWLLPFFHVLGIDARRRGKSDLFVNGKKFSGNAEYFTKGRVLHHGTLLYDTDLKKLHKILTPRSLSYDDRSVDSNPSQTINLKPLLPKYSTLELFAQALLQYVKEFLGQAQVLAEPPQEILSAANKYFDRYQTMEWIVGRSPNYRFKRSYHEKDRYWTFQAEVHRGKIEFYEWYFHPGADCKKEKIKEARFPGTYHHPGTLYPILKSSQGGRHNYPPEKQWNTFFF